MRRLTLDGIEPIDAIARSGSFSAAGVRLGKVTSTVSYAVGRLEADLEVALFHRRGPRVELTPAGRELLEEGRVLLQAADELACRVRRVADGWENEIRIAVDSLVPPMMFSALLERFAADAPATRVRLIGLCGTPRAPKWSSTRLSNTQCFPLHFCLSQQWQNLTNLTITTQLFFNL
jgi:DNA-binding transcriptional LysR family regulator